MPNYNNNKSPTRNTGDQFSSRISRGTCTPYQHTTVCLELQSPPLMPSNKGMIDTQYLEKYKASEDEGKSTSELLRLIRMRSLNS